MPGQHVHRSTTWGSTCGRPSARTRSPAWSAIASIVFGVSLLELATASLKRISRRPLVNPSVMAGSQLSIPP
jgi:hypothetical protein